MLHIEGYWQNYRNKHLMVIEGGPNYPCDPLVLPIPYDAIAEKQRRFI